jgi:hypothetical protein
MEWLNLGIQPNLTEMLYSFLSLVLFSLGAFGSLISLQAGKMPGNGNGTDVSTNVLIYLTRVYNQVNSS